MPVKFILKYFVRLFLKAGFGAFFLIALAAVPTNAATKVGKSAKIQNTVIGSQGERKLKVPDAVYAGEKINAVENSHGELQLDDGSKIIIGENSIVSLDDFAVSDGGIKKGTVRLTKGALRFITGNAEKGTYTVKTPISTIGVRGTGFDVYHSILTRITQIVLLHGEITACGRNSCVLARRSCDIVEIKDDGSASILPFLRNKDADKKEEDASFNLLADQNRFASDWRLGTRICDIRRTNLFLDNSNEERAKRSGNDSDPPEPEPDDDDDDDYPKRQ